MKKILVTRVHRTGKHELLPDHQTVAVAFIVELCWLVDSATPDSDHVVVRLNRSLNYVLSVLASYSVLEQVDWNEISSFRENGHVVNLEVEQSVFSFGLVWIALNLILY